MIDDILTTKEGAGYLKIKEKTAYCLVKIGGTWRFRRFEIENWITERVEGKRRDA